MIKKINLSVITLIYIIVYFAAMLAVVIAIKPSPTGEWDDYSLATSSIMAQHNLNISNGDVEEHQHIFPDFKDYIVNYSLSRHIAKDGGEMPWYFPTYSAACVPCVKILQLCGLRASYGFAITNVVSVFVMLLTVFFFLKVSDKRKLLLILLLSINPVIFYYTWISSEAFMYAVVGMAMVFWCNKQHKLAAFILAVASSMNPTILMCGIIMIIDYLAELFSKKPEDTPFFKYAVSQIKNILIYGSCWLVSLVPFAYNYYNTGHINLTASYDFFLDSKDSVFRRMLAYLFDWNFGVLPYFAVIFVLALIYFVISIFRRKWDYIKMMCGFFLTVYSFSMMAHVNSGMSGIARYNCWSSIVMLFAFGVYFDIVISHEKVVKTVGAVTAAGICLSGLVVYKYGLNRAQNTSYIYMTPIAKKVLEYAPYMYEPLHSTFNNRITHVDGGYEYTTPIVYANDEGKAKKVLADADDKEALLKSVSGDAEDVAWFTDKVNSLGEKEKYINIPRSRSISITIQSE